MVNWIYSNPTSLWGSIFVVLVTALSCLGLAIVHRFVDPEMRRKHNDIAAATMAIVGVAYAVLLAFIAVAAWQEYSDADKVVDATFEAITHALKGGDEVRLVGFGAFSVSQRAASEGRNPRTGEKIQIAASKQPKFSAGKGLKDAVNG